jgi:hypothetical protein
MTVSTRNIFFLLFLIFGQFNINTVGNEFGYVAIASARFRFANRAFELTKVDDESSQTFI